VTDQLIARLGDKSAVIGIIGLGYVGLPLLVRFAQSGYRVLGFDIDQEKVDKLQRGESYIRQIPSSALAAAAGNFEATAQFDRAGEPDALIVCVPTPLDEHREPDLSFVVNTTESVVPHLRAGQVFSLESTTWPGTTDEVVVPRIAATGLAVGKDIFVVFSPEREDPGNASFSTRTIPKLVGGVTPLCLRAGIALYEQVIDQVVPVSSTRVAEMAKLLENIHRAVNIGLVNEMKIVADRMNIDIHEVIRAAATKPFGFVPYRPGPGLGGHCIPIDPFYLSWKAREFGVNTRFIELAGEVNSNMPNWVAGKIAAALNDRRQSVNGSKVLVLGIAYKKNVDDTRESPAVAIMELLREMGAAVGYSDPWVPVFPRMRKHRFELASEPVRPDTIGRWDCVVVATDHDAFDWRMIREHARLIVDTRGVYLDPGDNLVKA
jgi:UDP-N-acetyl-D-glucosamine dehydrogenase